MRYIFVCLLTWFSTVLFAQDFENFRSVDGTGKKSSKTYIISAEEGDTLSFDYSYENSTHKMPNECYISFDQEERLSFGQSSVGLSTEKICLTAGEHKLYVSVWTQSKGPILNVRNVQILKKQNPDALTTIRESDEVQYNMYDTSGNVIRNPNYKSIYIYKGRKCIKK